MTSSQLAYLKDNITISSNVIFTSLCTIYSIIYSDITYRALEKQTFKEAAVQLTFDLDEGQHYHISSNVFTSLHVITESKLADVWVP